MATRKCNLSTSWEDVDHLIIRQISHLDSVIYISSGRSQLTFWDYEGMATRNRSNVKKCQHRLRLEQLEGRNVS